MKKIILFMPLLIFALEPTLVEVHNKIGDPLSVVSSNGSYIGIFEYGEGNTEFVPIARFTLEDIRGDIVYEKHTFGHTLVDIANNGIVVGIDFDGPISGKGILHFYDRVGQETNTYTIDFLLERTFAGNGQVYCVNDGKNGLVVFNSTGEKLYDLAKTNFFAVSDDGSVIATARDTGIDVYEHGQFIRHIPLISPFVRRMVLSNDGSQILYMDKKSIRFVDIRTGETIFQFKESNEHLFFISCDISFDRSLIIAGLDEDKGRNTPERHSRGIVYIFSAEGNIVWSEDVMYTRWNTSVPHVFFSDIRSFTIETIDDVLEYTY